MSRQAKVTDAGEGLKNYYSIQHPPTPFGYFPRKGGRCNSAQLAHIHHPLKFSSLRGNIHSARSNPEGITQLKTVGCVKPNNNTMDCRVAPAPRNDTQPVSLLTKKPNIYPPCNDAKLVVLPTNQNTFTPDGAQTRGFHLSLWKREYKTEFLQNITFYWIFRMFKI